MSLNLICLIMENLRITDEEIALIKDAQAGKMSAFNALYYRYKDLAFHVLNQYLKDEDEAQDLTNIVFLKVYNKLSSFDSYDSFGGWIRVIASRTALDYLRKSHNRLTKVDENDIRLMSESSSYDSDSGVVDHMSYNQILEHVNGLKEDPRKVFKLFYINDLSVEQISKRLAMPKGTVKSHLSRARRKIKSKLLKTKTL